MLPRVAQLAIHVLDRPAACGRSRRRRPRARRAPARDTSAATRRAAAARDVRVGSGGQQRQKRLDDRVVPATARRRARAASAGTPVSNVISNAVAYSRAMPSRSAASRITSSSVTVGSSATSCVVRPSKSARCRPANRRVHIARVVDRGRVEHARAGEARVATPYRASPCSCAVTRGRLPTRGAARASGASSSTMPRLVFERVQRAVASTARRTVAPSGRVPGAGERRADRGGAGQEILVARVGEVAARARRCPASARSTSSRQASCAASRRRAAPHARRRPTAGPVMPAAPRRAAAVTRDSTMRPRSRRRRRARWPAAAPAIRECR